MTRPATRTRLARAGWWAVVVSLAVAAVFYFLTSLSWVDRPYPGFKVRIDRAVELQLPPSSTGAQAGLMPGDRVLAVDGRALADPRDLYAYVAERPIGTRVTYDLERVSPTGAHTRLTKTIATQRHGWRQWASIFLALWLTGLAFLVLGAVVSASKPGDRLARASFAFHIAGAAACFSIFDQSTAYHAPLTDPIKLLPWLIAICFTHLALQFPRRYPVLDALRPWNLGFGLVGAGALAAAYALGRGEFWITFGHLGYIALGEVLLLANAAYAAFSSTSSPGERGQGKILLVGTLVSTVPALLVPQAHLLGVHVDLEGLENVAMPLWPLAISYAIARHQLFDISPLLKRSITYLVSAAVLTLLYVLGIAATEALIGSRTQVPGVVATVLVAFAFAPVRDRVKAWLDARFFRSPYRFAEVVAAFTRTAQESTDPRALMQACLEALDGALAPTRLAIVSTTEGLDASAARGFTDAERRALAVDGAPPDTWDGEPLLVVPLVVQSHRLGHAVLGPKKSALGYTALDRALVGELTQSLAVWLNLYERFEKARLQTQEIEALKRSEAMQGQFLNVVSHELKVPLSVMMSSLAILKRAEADQAPKTVAHHDRMRRSLTHLVGLVGDLLHAGQLQSGHFALRPRALDLAAVARDTAADMRPLAEAKSQAVTVEVAAPLPPIEGDEARLAQVFRNLLHNAIRYTPAHGDLRVTLAPDGDGVRCEVSDTGPGIAPDAMPHLFERFTQAHAEATDRDQGVGLGLFISKAIVEAHGGRIGVESRPGAGSTFWFTVPARVEAATSAAVSAAATTTEAG